MDIERKIFCIKWARRQSLRTRRCLDDEKVDGEKLTIPVAKIEGQTKMTFDEYGELSSMEENLSLVNSVNSNRVRNKRIARVC